MYLREIVVRNFKAFYGEHHLILPPVENSKNVYLIGALNGAGKSSLVQAMLVALYGTGAAGMPGVFSSGRDHRRKYETWIAASRNRQSRADADDSMTLRVTVEAAGTRIEATRTYWFAADGSFEDEHFVVVFSFADGAAETLHGDEAEERVVELVPRHLAELTFFDGERVRPLEQSDAGPWFSAALDRLLNLEPVKRAYADLQRLAREKRGLLADDNQRKAHDSIHHQLDEAQQQLAEIDAYRSDLRERVLEARSELARLDDQIAARGTGKVSTSVAQVEAEAQALRERQAELINRFGRHLGEWLYLDLVADLIEEIEGSAKDARDARERSARRKADAAAAARFANQLRRDPELLRLLRPRVQDQWEARVKELIPRAYREHTLPGPAWSKAFANDELDDLIAWSEHFTQRGREEVEELASDLLETERRVEELSQTRLKLDAATGLEATVRRRDELSARAIEWQAELSAADDAAADLRQRIATLRGSLSRLDSLMADNDETAQWLRTAERLSRALEEYMLERRTLAVAALADGVLARLRPVLHKRRLVTGVSVDPVTFEVTMRDASGNPVRLPSAGEQQIASLAFAAAMLDLADDHLPMIIDTPLARLDGRHRKNLVTKLLPDLDRQVIILSTDEEVDSDLLRDLGKCLAETYLVQHDDATGRSHIERGTYLEFASPTAVAELAARR